MATHSLKAFALAARQGRTREPLDILGLVKAALEHLPGKD
jgi:hypothetical protein